jgi:hypothetical protein
MGSVCLFRELRCASSADQMSMNAREEHEKEGIWSGPGVQHVTTWRQSSRSVEFSFPPAEDSVHFNYNYFPRFLHCGIDERHKVLVTIRIEHSPAPCRRSPGNSYLPYASYSPWLCY